MSWEDAPWEDALEDVLEMLYPNLTAEELEEELLSRIPE